MPRINVNLNDVEGGFPVLPDGLYQIEIMNTSKIKKAKEQGKAANILWIGKILDGDFEGQMLSWNTSLQENALWNLKAFIEKTDVEWGEDGFEMEDVFGEVLFVHNTSGNTYNGRLVNTIDAYYNAQDIENMEKAEAEKEDESEK